MIIELFAEQVALYPDNPAVIDDEGVLTLRELAAKATAVALAVRNSSADAERRGGEPRPVGLLCRRGGVMIAAMLGVLLAGRPYVQLDPSLPAGRLDDSGADLLLTDDIGHPLATGRRVLAIDAVLANASTVDLRASASPDDLAYLLYTSGAAIRSPGAGSIPDTAEDRIALRRVRRPNRSSLPPAMT
jgi:pyochelin synthetase